MEASMFTISDYILTIVEQGTFSNAAKQLHISQPALSIAVKKLETELGYQLFERSNNPLTLTAVGEIYVAKAQQVQTLQEELHDDLDNLKHNVVGTIKLGGAFISVNYLLPPLLKQFHTEYPQVHLDLQEAPFPELPSLLIQNKLDLAVDTDWFLNPNIETVQLFENHLLLAVADELMPAQLVNRSGYRSNDIANGLHLTDQRPKINLAELTELPFILMTPSNEIYQRTKSYFAEANFSPISPLTVNQQVSSFEFAKQYWGAAFITDTLVQSSPTVHDLHFYRIDSPEQPRFVAISYHKQQYISRAKQAFIDFATNYFMAK